MINIEKSSNSFGKPIFRLHIDGSWKDLPWMSPLVVGNGSLTGLVGVVGPVVDNSPIFGFIWICGIGRFAHGITIAMPCYTSHSVLCFLTAHVGTQHATVVNESPKYQRNQPQSGMKSQIWSIIWVCLILAEWDVRRSLLLKTTFALEDSLLETLPQL